MTGIVTGLTTWAMMQWTADDLDDDAMEGVDVTESERASVV